VLVAAHSDCSGKHDHLLVHELLIEREVKETIP
jgi:hypothetical protein